MHEIEYICDDCPLAEWGAHGDAYIKKEEKSYGQRIKRRKKKWAIKNQIRFKSCF